MNLNLMLCCNNPDNGLFAGKVSDIHIELPNGESVQLNGSPIRVSFIAQTEIRIGRTRAVMLNCREWVGNWCWDLVTVSGGSARIIANYLKSMGWSCQLAPTELYNRWLEAEPIEAEEWNLFLEDNRGCNRQAN